MAYPALTGHFARVITYKTGTYAQTLIDDFSKKTKAPHIAISVDMLDTGIDVPEVVNLVFFKLVRSKTKFWQMIGRGTRLCPDLFGPGQDKEFFRVFDFCQNLEFFGANPEMKEASAAKSLSERLFAARLDLVRALDEKHAKAGGFAEEIRSRFSPVPTRRRAKQEIRASTRRRRCRMIVAGLNLDNFIVRQHRRAVEKYQKPKPGLRSTMRSARNWSMRSRRCPRAKRLGTEDAKRFDLLMFSLELALLKGSKRFDALAQATA